MKISNEKKLLWQEAISRYPVGCKFRVVHKPDMIYTVASHKPHPNRFVESSTGLHVNLLREITAGEEKARASASVYFNGQWAEIVSYPDLASLIDGLDERIRAMEERSKT